MRCQQAWMVLSVVGLVLSGCGGGQSPQRGTAAQHVPGPEQVVSRFLDAVRKGDEQAACKLLTQLAREKTEAMDLRVTSVEGSDTAAYEIGQIEVIGGELAHVASKVTDIGDDGQPQSSEVLWVLRLEPEGWRIGGMAIRLFDDDLPLLLNFEDPEDMERKKQLAAEEMERRARSAVEQAQKTGAQGQKL